MASTIETTTREAFDALRHDDWEALARAARRGRLFARRGPGEGSFEAVDFEIFLVLALLHRGEGDLLDLEKRFEPLGLRTPIAFTLFEGIGVLYALSGNYAPALERLERAGELMDRNWKTLPVETLALDAHNRTVVLGALGRLEESRLQAELLRAIVRRVMSRYTEGHPMRRASSTLDEAATVVDFRALPLHLPVAGVWLPLSPLSPT